MKLILILALLYSFSSFAMDDKKDSLPLSPANMFFSAVVVKNVDSSIAWYSKVFDLKIRDRTDNPQRGFKQVNLHNDKIFIELIELKKAISGEQFLTGEFKDFTLHGYRKLGFSVTDINAWHKRLADMQIRFRGSIVTDRINNKKTFLVYDPDDNLIQFFEE